MAEEVAALAGPLMITTCGEAAEGDHRHQESWTLWRWAGLVCWLCCVHNLLQNVGNCRSSDNSGIPPITFALRVRLAMKYVYFLQQRRSQTGHARSGTSLAKKMHFAQRYCVPWHMHVNIVATKFCNRIGQVEVLLKSIRIPQVSESVIIL